jgi:hypothetical protein
MDTSQLEQLKSITPKVFENWFVHHSKVGRLMSQMGLGCVKTWWRGEPMEWTFCHLAFSVVRILKRSQF